MKTLLDSWSEEERRNRDHLDLTVAALMIVDDAGIVKARSNLTDRQIELIDRWRMREEDPGYLRMRWVQRRRQERARKRWPDGTASFIISVLVGAIVIWNKQSIVELILVCVIYFSTSTAIRISNLLEKQEEDQILREWEMHKKIDYLREDVYYLKRCEEGRTTTLEFNDRMDRLTDAIRSRQTSSAGGNPQK